MMDTSETYIKMSDCPEIQALKPAWGDDWHKQYFTHRSAITGNVEDDGIIWLPRQDQLQEMVGGFEAGMIDWLEWQHNIYPETRSPFVRLFTSFEQLWLAFVMKEKYNKIWTGKEWE